MTEDTPRMVTNWADDMLTTHSPTIGKIAEALAAAQGKIVNAAKSGVNPHFKSRYADLASIVDACKAPLSEAKIAVVQMPQKTEHGTVLETMLIHSSGEWLKGTIPIEPVKRDPQGVGSAITYMRRYCLAAMVGVAPEDDDGEAASGRGNGTKAQRPTVTTEHELSQVAVPNLEDEKARWSVWCKDFLAAAEKCPDVANVNRLQTINLPALGMLQKTAPKWYASVMERLDILRGNLSQAPAAEAIE